MTANEAIEKNIAMLKGWLHKANASANFALITNQEMHETNQEAIRQGVMPRFFVATQEAINDLGKDVIFGFGNVGAELLLNRFGNALASRCWAIEDFDFDHQTRTGTTGKTYRLVAHLQDDFLLICVAKQGQIGMPGHEGEQAPPCPPLPEWADQWGERLGWPKKLRGWPGAK